MATADVRDEKYEMSHWREREDNSTILIWEENLGREVKIAVRREWFTIGRIVGDISLAISL